jgi:tetratricopeptide (TPR) repeat protein
VGSTKSHHTAHAKMAQGPMSFVAVAGKAIDIDREFILTNSCQQRHVYRVTNPLNLSWFQFKGEDQFAIEGNATRNIKFSIRLDATNVTAGTFDSQITFPCLDCSNEPGCRVGGFLLPITMKVLGSPNSSPAAAPVVSPTPTPSMAPTPVPSPSATPTPKNAVTVTRMQEFVLPSTGGVRRAELTPQQVEQTLSWSHQLIMSAAPKYSAQSVIPYYPNATEREAAFSTARRSSTINDDRRSKQILSETFIDWGNGAKAEEELKGVEVTIVELPGQLATLGEARRLIGDLTKAEALIKRAIGLDSKLMRAYNALGSVYLDQAKVDLDRKDYAAGRASLDKAKAEFAKAMALKANAPAKWEAVVQTNLAEVHLRLGIIARGADDNAGALRELQSAEQAFTQAAKSDASYPFALTGLGEVYRELATTQESLGNQSRADQYLKRSQEQYDQALILQPDLAEAYVGLGRVLEENGRKDEALKQYRKAILMRPELADPHYYYAKALSDVDRQQAAEQARLFLKLERPSLMAGERARNAQDVIASRPIGGKTAVSGTNR